MIRKTAIPTDSLVRNYLPADYTDAYCCEVGSEKGLSADALVVKNLLKRVKLFVA